jgi:hypothetical protein
MTSADPARTPLMDVHAHFLTDHYVHAAKDAGHLPGPDGGPGWPTWRALTTRTVQRALPRLNEIS